MSAQPSEISQLRVPPKRGKTACRHRMRCRRCKTRFTLKRSPAYYRRPVRCPACKTTNVRSVEMERRREDARRGRCCCGRYPFPHRIASLRFCEHHPKADQEPTDDELAAYQATLDTPRSGFA